MTQRHASAARPIAGADVEPLETPWAKLLQNGRSSRETELASRFPLHTVCGWLGNTATIAAKHDLQTTEEHFAKATKPGPKSALRKALQNALQDGAVRGRKGLEGQGPELVGASNHGPS